ncbi:hypothetical protein [Glutamicibacter sp. NPDC087344]|uniref:hypothetical protein n=1 Tax=Glutamicibacter sp. NPDC087344 TaxID=3363994 RepID=UPI003816B94B
MTPTHGEPIFIFPDTNLFMNFAVVEQLDTLRLAIGLNGLWTETIYAETSYLVRQVPILAEVFEFMPDDPHRPSGLEMNSAEQIRLAFTAPGDGRRKHLGEAETMAVILSRYGAAKVVFVTEDRNVLGECARRKIPTTGTKDLLAALAIKGKISWVQANAIAQSMRAAGRPILGYPPDIHPPMPPGLRTNMPDY